MMTHFFFPAPALNPCIPVINPLALRKPLNLRRPPPNKFPQILPRRNPQHKPPSRIRHNRKLLLLIAGSLALKERLEFFKRRLHSNESVLAALAAEAHHGFLDAVILGDGFAGELGFDGGRGDVAEQGFGVGVEDGEVRVVALEGGEEGLAEGG